jgi:alkylation response protein AidB-like acyl-CoA dehydrogenase
MNIVENRVFRQMTVSISVIPKNKKAIPMQQLKDLDLILNSIVEPQARITDVESKFPRDAMRAFGECGILGLMSAKDIGGMGFGLKEATQVIERVAKACPSTAMVLTMHYCGTAVYEKSAHTAIRKEIAAGKHLTTLAWSDVGSRSHFWTPMGTAEKNSGAFLLNSQKTMVTTAGEASSYVWSTKPVKDAGASTLWSVPSGTPGLSLTKNFDGIGLRGNSSAPMEATEMRLSTENMIGADGGGFDIMIGTVLPIFSVLIATGSIGIMESVIEKSIGHLTNNKFEHLGSSLAELPTIRAYIARAKILLDQTRTLRDDTLAALGANRADAMLRVMEVKAAAAEAALQVSDIGMRVCGGAAFRKEIGVERFFRDARAASIMAPTSDVLYDFIGKAICGQPVFG